MSRKLKSKVKTRPMCYPEFDKWLDDTVHRWLADEEDLDDLVERSYEEALREEEEEEPWSIEVESKRGRNRKKSK